ncbi:VanW family protein [Robertmurraya massiliosenegalensis]|uniref:VanW family protein n=1 Tax=Robertmurraya massiliosenegalensis TaxID=1287657 RepID=UPI00031CD834|nr:VanW family protein [Robertmurraya massiliosenegalensis]
MHVSWMLSILLLIHPQNGLPLQIKENDDTLAIVNRKDITLPMPGLELVDPFKYEQLLSQIEQQIEVKPEVATLSDSGNIIPEKVGSKLNRHAFTEQFFQYYFNNRLSTLEVPKIRVYPKVDSELLSIIRTKRIGQYITYFNSRNKARSNNIALAVEAINNEVVFPGEIFSFNKVVGQRTVEKGYMKAPEIVKGELIEGIGGGICQVSSTLFNAVDYSGVTMVERFSHSKHVPYVPPGRDATVSWYGPDFSFKNEYNQPILIRAKVIGGMVIVFVYSSEDINYQPRKITY